MPSILNSQKYKKIRKMSYRWLNIFHFANHILSCEPYDIETLERTNMWNTQFYKSCKVVYLRLVYSNTIPWKHHSLVVLDKIFDSLLQKIEEENQND